MAGVQAAADETRVERQRLLDLQRLLLPGDLPEVGCTEVAAVYRAHNDHLRLGGDWYDVVDRDDGQVVVLVGDVVGHGVEQISVMGQLRAAANALARSCGQPEALVADLDRFARDLPGAELATVQVLMIDGSTTGRLVSAGHPPLIHVDGHGEVHVLEVGRRAPLTIGPVASEGGRFQYQADDLLVMYTDGLVEREGGKIDDAIVDVGTMAAGLRAEPCAVVAARLLAKARDARDDVAIMVLRPRYHRSDSYALDRSVPSSVAVG